MRSSASSSNLRFAACVVAVVFCPMAGSARADNGTSFYAGNFPAIQFGNFWGPGAGANIGGSVMYDGSDPNLYFQFSFGGPIDNFQETQWCGYECPQFATGTINSGTVSFFGDDNSGNNPPYSFDGYIISGGTFSAEVVCDPTGCAWDESVDLKFRSSSGSNGWASTGELQLTGGNDGSGGQDFGNLELNTYAATTPEPGTFLLFGSGLLGLGGVLRRKIASRK